MSSRINRIESMLFTTIRGVVRKNRKRNNTVLMQMARTYQNRDFIPRFSQYMSNGAGACVITQFLDVPEIKYAMD